MGHQILIHCIARLGVMLVYSMTHTKRNELNYFVRALSCQLLRLNVRRTLKLLTFFLFSSHQRSVILLNHKAHRDALTALPRA